MNDAFSMYGKCFTKQEIRWYANTVGIGWKLTVLRRKDLFKKKKKEIETTWGITNQSA